MWLAVVVLALALSRAVSAVDELALAKSRIRDLQKRYSIDWEDRPSVGGKELDKNSDPNVVVYIERHIEKSYINIGGGDDTFSLTKSTTVIKDVTDGTVVSAQSSTGFQLTTPLSFSISKGGSRNEQVTKSNGSYTSDIRTRIETCKQGHACRFETWTYLVQIKGNCRGSPCDIRSPITGPDGKPMTAVIYIPEKLPAGVDAVQASLLAELERGYCIEWDRPPTKDAYRQQLSFSSSVARPAAKLLDKHHKVSFHIKRVAEPGRASMGDADSLIVAERSRISIQSSTKGWSAGAQTTSQYGLSLKLPSPASSSSSSLSASGGVQFSSTKAEDTSKQHTNGEWVSDGFSIRSTCRIGQYCNFEAWTFYAHFSGICQNLWNLPLQRRCEFDVPIFNGAGEPLVHFVSISEDAVRTNRTENETQSIQADSRDADMHKDASLASSGDEKRPKALGAIEHLCMLDNYEYWGIDERKYLDYNKDKFVKDSSRPEPENLEHCKEPLPAEPVHVGPECYNNEIRAGTSRLPEDAQVMADEKKQGTPGKDHQGTPEKNIQGTSRKDNKDAAPKEHIQVAPQVQGPAIIDEHGHTWCPLDGDRWFNPYTERYWSPDDDDGLVFPGAPKPQGLEKCTETGAGDAKGTHMGARATGDVRKDQAERYWCVLDNNEWYDKVEDLYFKEDDVPGDARPGEAKPRDLDKCNIPGKQEQGKQGDEKQGDGKQRVDKQGDEKQHAGKQGDEKQGAEKQGKDCQTVTSVKVTFRLAEATIFGQSIKLVGNTDVLGNWDTSKAVELDAFEYQHPARPMWKGVVTLQAGQRVEYKFVKVERDGREHMEAGGNHSWEVPRTCAPTAERMDRWQ